MSNYNKKIMKLIPSVTDPILQTQMDLLADRLPTGDVFTAFQFDGQGAELWHKHHEEVMTDWQDKNSRPQSWYLANFTIEQIAAAFGHGSTHWGAWGRFPFMRPDKTQEKAFLKRHGVI